MTDSGKSNQLVSWLSQYSVPLIVGVITALVLANLAPQFYHSLTHTSIVSLFERSEQGHSPSEHSAHATGSQLTKASFHGQRDDHAPKHENHASSKAEHHDGAGGHDEGHGDWRHFFSMHFLVNEIFMVFFFGIAAKEITEACLPEGALNPIQKAINPLFATLGGILGPVAVYLGLNALVGSPDWWNGWGIPTATDIALAWLVAKLIFGKDHPAIAFLLLLAVADDAIGLAIIAIAYPDPLHPTVWANVWWVIPGMLSAYAFRRMKVTSWIPYIVVGGAFCWWGLYSAHLHPALALVFVVPFMPGHDYDLGLYLENRLHAHDTPLDNFERDMRLFVDMGLFFFALANAGVMFAGISNLTWIVLLSLIVGKTIGVTMFSLLANLLGFPLSKGMEVRHLFVVAIISGLGLTVALFVSGQAFQDAGMQGAAKMGAVLSVAAALAAYLAAIALGIVKKPTNLWPRPQNSFPTSAKGFPT